MGVPAVRQIQRRQIWLRVGLVALALPNTVVGAWLLFAPHSFYTSFPGFGQHWVEVLGPYSEHAFSDFGGALLALALLTWLAAWWLERRLVQAALLAVLLQSLAHFIYHLTRLSAMSAVNDLANQLSLAYGVVLSLVLLFVVQRDVTAAPPSRPARS